MKNIPKKILLLGSGGLKIGQAGEFDYSGTQAIKAFKEEGCRVILINPNIATIQTEEGLADAVYFLPVTPEYVEKIIKKEKPDAISLSFGGQTALNCGLTLEKTGVLKKHKVRVLGTPVTSIEDTEDRKIFAERLQEIGVPTPKSIAAHTLADARKAAEKIGFPIMIRAGFALGGRGSGLCKDIKEFDARVPELLSSSPQVLIEEWHGGWREVEYEVVRDFADNCITVCNMENFDPLGVHTGESIVVAPSQTLTNAEYHLLREVALKTIRHLKIVGECNIQYALDTKSREFRVIEVNARLSRSSALASKATGYPLAFVAAKLALGYTLPEIKNSVTGVTSACFEPALDYCVIKMPRWDLQKFKNAERKIGSEMKSVGEVMGVGRTFEEALQKCVRMIDTGAHSLCDDTYAGSLTIADRIHEPNDTRLFAIAQSLLAGKTIEHIHHRTQIDLFFLKALKRITDAYIQTTASKKVTIDSLRSLKELGFDDFSIGKMIGKRESDIRVLRKKMRITPVIKSIDTLAGEFPAKTEYLYFTYHGTSHDVVPKAKKASVLVLGSGTYRIGSSVEFDWCSVNAVQTLRNNHIKAIVLNSNPETVSTDYDVSDRLFFDELSLERVLDVCDFENPRGAIVSVGGQTPNQLALPLSKNGVKILGTHPKDIDTAENRHEFSKMLDALHIDQPEWKELTSYDDVLSFTKRVGFPVLVRPSYVLSGAAMNVVWSEQELKHYLQEATDINPHHPVVVTKFVSPAKEIEIDAVADNGKILIYAIGEHIENAGVHSGDASIILPAQSLYVGTIRVIKRIAKEIAHSLKITGPFNIQFLAHENKVQVIECNVRASRSFPFCSKIYRRNFIELATEAMIGMHPEPVEKSLFDIDYVGVKTAQFSFGRIKGNDPRLGVEMRSTGEVATLSHRVSDALKKSLTAVDVPPPVKGILISVNPERDGKLVYAIASALTAIKLPLFATEKTSALFTLAEIPHTVVTPDEVRTIIEQKKIDLILNIPTHPTTKKTDDTNGSRLRKLAVARNIPLITNAELAMHFITALYEESSEEPEVLSWQEY